MRKEDLQNGMIVKLKDGKIIDDSDPYIVLDEEEEMPEHKNLGKSSMSLWTAFTLSFNNLLTKKARTILVSFAGSIGIIGIALILSLSSGFQIYIDNVQKDTLSTYPITINAATVDYSSMLQMIMGSADSDNKPSSDDTIHSDDVLLNMFKGVLAGSKSNDLKKFKAFLDENEEIKQYTSGIQYTYNLDLNIYDIRQEVVDGQQDNIITQLNPNNMFGQGVQAFFTSLAINELTQDQLVIMKGGDPATITISEKKLIVESATEEEKNMAYAMVVSNPSKIAIKISELMADFSAATSTGGSTGMDAMSMLGGMDLGIWNEMIDNPKLLQSQYEVMSVTNGTNKDTLFESLKENEIVLVVDKNGNLSDYNLYALGIKYSPTIEEVASGLATDMKGYKIEPSEFKHSDVLGKKYPMLLETDYYQKIDSNGNIDNDNGILVDIRQQIKSMQNPAGLLTQSQYDEIIEELLSNTELTLEIKAIVKAKEGVSATAIGGPIGYTHALTEKIINMQNAEIVAKGISGTEVASIDLSRPNSINIYCVDFESKEEIERIINEYNEGKPEEDQISYTDLIGVMMSSVTTIINAISYVLIAFVSISLIVSSIMIGIITYISVLERTKEIGILRSVGASKRDVKRVFTAESLIIGTMSGVFGIVVTLFLNIPINLIITLLSGLTGIASLPIVGALVLVGISMLLTFIAGLIPAQFASKKDPVVALRTE